jgi:hypothetical protein
VPLWRREPLHRRLAREGGLEGPAPHHPGPHWGAVGIHGVPRPREWDATGVAEAAGVRADELEFVVLPDGTLLAEEDGDAGPLADAIEATLAPPFRAQAVRRGAGLFAVAANAIRVEELPDHVAGDLIELTVGPEGRFLVVDGRPAFGSVPELERLAGEAAEYVVRAIRLDGPFWQVEVTPL